MIEALCQLSEIPGVGWSCLLCRQVFEESSATSKDWDWSVPPLWGGQCPLGLPCLGGQLTWNTCVLQIVGGGGHLKYLLSPKCGTDPHFFLPTQQDFPRISNYLQSHIAIYHTDAMWSFSEGIWQNYMLLKKRKKYSIFRYPKGSQKLDLFFQDTHTRGITSNPGRFLIKGIQDNDNFQHD